MYSVSEGITFQSRSQPSVIESSTNNLQQMQFLTGASDMVLGVHYRRLSSPLCAGGWWGQVQTEAASC